MAIEYKYVLIDENNNKIWEELPNNSVLPLTMKKPGDYLVINEIGKLDLKIIDKKTKAEVKVNSKLHLNLIENQEKEENENKKVER